MILNPSEMKAFGRSHILMGEYNTIISAYTIALTQQFCGCKTLGPPFSPGSLTFPKRQILDSSILKICRQQF